MKSAAVFFPGIGYGFDRPLFQVCIDEYKKQGFDIIKIDYGNIDPKSFVDLAKAREEVLGIVCGELERADIMAYDRAVFVGKSFGTAVAGAANERMRTGARLLFLTPIEQTLEYMTGGGRVIAAATGTLDQFIDSERVVRLCDERGIPCVVVEGARHSLTVGDEKKDAETLDRIRSLCIY